MDKRIYIKKGIFKIKSHIYTIHIKKLWETTE